MASTVLAIASHHFVFGVMPSWGPRALVAMGLFGAALPLSARPVSVGRWVAIVFGGQAVACWSLRQASSGLTGGARDDWFLVPVHVHQSLIVAQLALTLLVACMLHGADSACRRLLHHAGRELQVAWSGLLRRLRPMLVPCAPVLPQPHVPRSPGPVRAPPVSLLLADAVVRRGPPSRPPLAV
ncbi:hypothetical protein ACFQ0X_02125 [Streptomyces rectiviolaceus]|uniref:hypothetical protein n=1 Tax=Streptomyces rectiviolaceus TaxID=332591 RepID=UPI0031E090C1